MVFRKKSKRKNSPRNKRRSNSLNYQVLEPRLVLAAPVAVDDMLAIASELGTEEILSTLSANNQAELDADAGQTFTTGTLGNDNKLHSIVIEGPQVNGPTIPAPLGPFTLELWTDTDGNHLTWDPGTLVDTSISQQTFTAGGQTLTTFSFGSDETLGDNTVYAFTYTNGSGTRVNARMGLTNANAISDGTLFSNGNQVFGNAFDTAFQVNVLSSTSVAATNIEYILANDSDADGDALSVQSTSNPQHGTISLIGGEYHYTPDPGYYGDDSFTYVVEDTAGNTDTGTVHLSVNIKNFDVETERGILLDGVTPASGENIGMVSPGQPANLVVYGPTAFSVINYDGESANESYVTAGSLGAGRFVAFGDQHWLNFNSFGSDPNTKNLYLNSLEWLGATNLNSKIVVLAGGQFPHGTNGAWLTSQGYTNVQQVTSFAAVAGAIANADVVVATWLGVNATEAQAKVLADYTKGGGGLMIAEYGAAYGGFFTERPLEEAPGNMILRDAGAYFTDSRKFISSVIADRAEGHLTGAEILEILNGASVSNDVRLAAFKTAGEIFRNLPETDALRSALADAFRENQLGTIQATPNNPVSDDFGKAFLTAEASLLSSSNVNEQVFHPTAQTLYGTIPANAVRVNGAIVPIDTSTTGWLVTGHYAVPGEVVTIEVPNELVGKGYEFRISGHHDDISNRADWSRIPSGISKTFAIDSNTIQIANSFGGAIYLDVGGRSAGTRPNLGIQNIEITGAIEAPTFVLGQTTNEQWAIEMQKPAPYVELVSEHIAFSLPKSELVGITDIVEVVAYWNAANEFQDFVGATEHLRTGPSRINTDVQISTGFLHAGYPVQGPISTAQSIVDLSNPDDSSRWGYLHELGHQHQRNYALGYGTNSAFTFDGDVEVTVNIFANASLELHADENETTVSWGYSSHPDEVLARAKTTIDDGSATTFDAKDPYPFYFSLADGPWGWQGYRDVMRTYIDQYENSPGSLPSSNAQKKDQWLIRWSQVTGYDMTEYFVDNWKLTVSTAALNTVAAMNLDSYMPLAVDRSVLFNNNVNTNGSRQFNLGSAGRSVDNSATLISVGQGSKGTVTNNGGGLYTYSANNGAVGKDAFDVVYRSSANNLQTFSVSIDILGQLPSPVATNDQVVIDADQMIAVSVLNNDSDPSGQDFEIDSFTQASHGAVADTGSGVLNYFAAAGFAGEDQFTYTIKNENGDTATATVKVFVRALSLDADLGDASGQRSNVSTLSVDFKQLVNFSNNNALTALSLYRTDNSQNVGLIVDSIDESSGSTVVNLRFTGSLTRGNGALVDGNYRLDVDGQSFTLRGSSFNGNDFSIGDNATEDDKFFAFFGDINGDREVDGFDLFHFRNAYRTEIGDPGFNGAFDYDGDGEIDGIDLFHFRNRYRSMLNM